MIRSQTDVNDAIKQTKEDSGFAKFLNWVAKKCGTTEKPKQDVPESQKILEKSDNQIKKRESSV